MPPIPKKKKEEPEEVFVFEKDRMVKENYTTRQQNMEKSLHVVVRPSKCPHEKLKERLNTYKNVRKMKTDYKNYVKRYGTPSFYVPEELWRVT
jgi:hypothetical protein